MNGVSILFTQSPGVASRAVRWFTRSLVSHVGVGFTVDEIPLVLHAYGRGGVQIEQRPRFLKDRTVVAEYTVQRDVSLKQLLDDLGDKYDYPSIARYALSRVSSRFRKPLHSPDALVCSELVAQLPLLAFYDLDPEDTTPEELLDRCESSGELRLVGPEKL